MKKITCSMLMFLACLFTVVGQVTPSLVTNPFHLLHLQKLADQTYKNNIKETYVNGHNNTSLPGVGEAQYLRTAINYLGYEPDLCLALDLGDGIGNIRLDELTPSIYEAINEALNESNTQIQLMPSVQDINGVLKTHGAKSWPTLPGTIDFDPETNLPTIASQQGIEDITATHFPTSHFLNIYVVDNILYGGEVSGIRSTALNHVVLTNPADQDLAGIYIQRKYIDPNSQFYDIDWLAKAIGNYLGLLPTYSGSVNGGCPPELEQLNPPLLGTPNPNAPYDPEYGDGIPTTEMMPKLSNCNQTNPCSGESLSNSTGENIMSDLPCAKYFNEAQTKIMHRFINEYLEQIIYGLSFNSDDAEIDDCDLFIVGDPHPIFRYGLPVWLSGVTEVEIQMDEYDLTGRTRLASYTQKYTFPFPVTGLYLHKYREISKIPQGYIVDYTVRAKGPCISGTKQYSRTERGIPYELTACAERLLDMANLSIDSQRGTRAPQGLVKTSFTPKQDVAYNFGPFYKNYEMGKFEFSNSSISIADTEFGKYGNFIGNEVGDHVSVNIYEESNIINSTLNIGKKQLTTGSVNIEPNGVLRLNNAMAELSTGSKILSKAQGRIVIEGNTTITLDDPSNPGLEIQQGGILDLTDGSVLNLQGEGIVSIEGSINVKEGEIAKIDIGTNIVLDVSGVFDLISTGRLDITGTGTVQFNDAGNLTSDENAIVTIRSDKPLPINVLVSADILVPSSFWVYNANLNFSHNGSIHVVNSFRLDASTITAEGSNNGNPRIVLYGQPNSRLIGNSFINIEETAITLNNYGHSSTDRTIISNNSFVNCENAVLSFGDGVFLSGNKFTDGTNQSSVAVTQINSSIDSWISGNDFIGQYFGVEFYGTNTGSVSIRNSNFINNHFAVLAENEDISMRCSKIESGLPYNDQRLNYTPSIPPMIQFDYEVARDVGLSLLNCQLDISDESLNNFNNLEYAVRTDESKSIFINEGGNIFNNPGYSLAGKLRAGYEALYNTGTGFQIDGYKNVIPKYNVKQGQYSLDINTFALQTSSLEDVILKTDNLPSLANCGIDSDGPIDPTIPVEEIDPIIKLIKEGTFDGVSITVNGVSAGNLLEMALTEISTTEEKKNTLIGVDRLLDILEVGLNISEPNEIEKYLLKITYDELLKAIGLGVYHNEIQVNQGDRVSNTHPLIDRVLAYIDNKIAFTFLDEEIDQYTLDKAVILGTTQYFNKANEVLTSSDWTESRLEIKAKELICFYSNLDKFWNQEMTHMELTHSLINCSQSRKLESDNYEILVRNNGGNTPSSGGEVKITDIEVRIIGSEVLIQDFTKDITNVSIYNMLGEHMGGIYLDGLGSKSVKFNSSRLPNGVYIVHIISGDDESVEKLIIER